MLRIPLKKYILHFVGTKQNALKTLTDLLSLEYTYHNNVIGFVRKSDCNIYMLSFQKTKRKAVRNLQGKLIVVRPTTYKVVVTEVPSVLAAKTGKRFVQHSNTWTLEPKEHVMYSLQGNKNGT